MAGRGRCRCKGQINGSDAGGVPRGTREIARKTKRGLFVPGRDGQIRERNTYGKDPGAEGLTVSEARSPEEDTIEAPRRGRAAIAGRRVHGPDPEVDPRATVRTRIKAPGA